MVIATNKRLYQAYKEVITAYKTSIKQRTKKEQKYELYSKMFSYLTRYYNYLELEEFVNLCGMIQERLGIR